MLGAAAAGFLLQACNGTKAPVFVSPDGSVMVGINGPDVDERLAEEAWQKRLIFHVGPIDLPAGTAAEEMEDAPLIMRFNTGEDLWVTAFEPRVVSASGAGLPGELLSRAMLINLHEENELCGQSGSGNAAFVATSMLTDVELPQGYGYPVLATDPLEARAVLMNRTGQGHSGVYFEITLKARPMNEFANLKDVKPMLVEFDPCGHAAVDIEPGAFSERSASYRLSKGSRVIMVNGAMGDRGASMELVAGSEIAPFWRSEATLDEGQGLVALSDNPFVDMRTTLAEGDEIKFSAAFDNSSGGWLRGATAAAMMYVNPAE
ncbi:MAG: hypothetical protein JXA24_06070 [Proteobacteria bacterium]|nr:hypothetical protein [Pseudomonadota bacterium]